jgi:enoyl-CoA hydratase/carnithine racemase
MPAFVRTDTDGAVATIRLLRPRINGVNPAVPGELHEAAHRVDSDTVIRAGIIYGGRHIFCSGADVRSMVEHSYPEVTAHTARLQAGFNAVATIAKPVIAAITGFALGGGLELALCADYRIVGRSAQLGLPEIRLGIIPGTGGTQRLARLIGPGPAKKLIFTGRRLTADEAFELGLVDEVVADKDVYPAARALADEFAQGPTAALAAAKQAVDGGIGVSLATGLEIERLRFSGLFATEDQQIGFRAFLDDTEPKFRGR